MKERHLDAVSRGYTTSASSKNERSNQARALLDFWTGRQITPDTLGELTLPAEEGVAILKCSG